MSEHDLHFPASSPLTSILLKLSANLIPVFQRLSFRNTLSAQSRKPRYRARSAEESYSMASYPLTIKRKPLPSVDYVRVPDEQFSTITDGADGKEEMSLRKYSPALAFFQWWLPEIFASMLSVVSLLFLVVLLRHYEGRGIHDLNLPSSLTLNGLVAILSTLIRVSIMVPIGSAISQEVWLWLLKSRKDCGRLQNLEFSDAASRGAWGSLIFLIRARTRYCFAISEKILKANVRLPQLACMLWCFGDDYIPGLWHVHSTAACPQSLSSCANPQSPKCTSH